MSSATTAITIWSCPQSITVISEAFDAIKSILNHIEKNGHEPDTDFTALIKKLDAIHEAPGMTSLNAALNAELYEDIQITSRAITGRRDASRQAHLLPISKAWSKLPISFKSFARSWTKKSICR